MTIHSNEFLRLKSQDFTQDEAFSLRNMSFVSFEQGFLVQRGMQVCVAGGSSHLVDRHGELLELHVKLWVASRGGGKLGLCSGLPAAKKTQTCDSNYDLHKDLSLCKSQRERGRSQAKKSPFPLQLMSDDDIICTGRAVSHG